MNGILWRQSCRLLEKLDRLTVAVQLEQDIAQSVAIVRILGIEVEGFGCVLESLFLLTGLQQRPSQICVRGSIFRVQLKGACVHRNGIGNVVLLEADIAPVIVRDGEIGIESDDLLECVARKFKGSFILGLK